VPADSSRMCSFHASALVCLLVRCACDPRHASPDTPALLDAVVNSALLPRVAHLAFASPSCSCLHTAFLDALSIHTLPRMPAVVWAPLLLPNFGLPAETDGISLDTLPGLLFLHGAPLCSLSPLPAILLLRAPAPLFRRLQPAHASTHDLQHSMRFTLTHTCKHAHPHAAPCCVHTPCASLVASRGPRRSLDTERCSAHPEADSLDTPALLRSPRG
jgi:hypothetical protein